MAPLRDDGTPGPDTDPGHLDHHPPTPTLTTRLTAGTSTLAELVVEVDGFGLLVEVEERIEWAGAGGGGGGAARERLQAGSAPCR